MTQRKCGAKRTNGEICQSFAMANGRCRVHGGATPKGVASPNFRHGRYSKSMPEHLASRYAEALTDSRLLELRDEISLVDVRMADLLAKLDEEVKPDDSEVWKEILDTIGARQRLVESERRRYVEMQSIITIPQALAMVGAIVAIVRENVTDPKVLNSIATGIDRLIADNEPE